MKVNSKLPDYNKCSMTLVQHVIAYIISTFIIAAIAYLFYHITILSIVIGAVLGVFLERYYQQICIRKRKKKLRLQFREFLEAMNVAVRAGNVEVKAISSALKDLRLVYNEKADIILEVDNIIKQYERGGIQLTYLFEDFGERSDIEDIQSFATIYSVIEGKSDRFGDILTQTQEIIADKIEIQQEIETTITAAKSETNMMLVMPIIIVLLMSVMGEGILDSLFNTLIGHITATIALIIFAISYVLAVKASNIKV